jgi:hypothetical protein
MSQIFAAKCYGVSPMLCGQVRLRETSSKALLSILELMSSSHSARPPLSGSWCRPLPAPKLRHAEGPGNYNVANPMTLMADMEVALGRRAHFILQILTVGGV